ncbi:MAG: protein translocase subunit SecD, partial [Chloroflexi bacterium]|nr:protein translocase subunit SecD [Chloroflexota bacterium]
MSNSLKFRGVVVLLCLLLSLFAMAPTLMRGSLPQWWLDTFGPIQLGLDLQGGMHLVLGVDVDKAVESRIDTILDQTENQLHEKDIIFKRLERRQGDRLVVLVYDDVEGAKVDALMTENYPSLEAETFTGAGGYIEKHFRLSDNEIENIKDYAVRQALETMRNRVDQFGVSEPTLQRQSGHRILIQLPGVKDPDRAIGLLGKTARLEFKLVAEDANLQEAIAGNLPEGTQLLYERNTNRSTGAVTEIPLLVIDKTVLTGDLL